MQARIWLGVLIGSTVGGFIPLFGEQTCFRTRRSC